MHSFWMLAASFLFAVMAASVKLASPEIGPFSMIFWRGLFGAVTLGIWAMASSRSLATPFFWGHVKRSGIGTLALGMWLWAVTQLPLSTGITLNYTSPLFMAAMVSIGAIVSRRPVEWKLAAACVIGFLGVVKVLQPEFRAGDLVPALVGLGSGFFSGVAYIMIRELSQAHEPDWRVVFYFSVFNMAFGLVCHILFEPADTYTVQSVACIIVAGASATLAQITMTRSYGSGNLLLSSVLSFSAIIFAVLIGLVLFGEALTLSAAIGIAIIIGAGAAASIITKRALAKTAAGNKAD